MTQPPCPAPMSHRFRHIFLDLDGTVLDSAPGLIDITNELRAQRRLPPLEPQQLLASISFGIKAILDAAFDAQTLARERQDLHHGFVEIYQRRCCRNVHLYPGIDALLDGLDRRGIAWSIISNKREDLCRRVAACLGIDGRASLILGGDSLSRCKPEPDQITFACTRLGLACQHTLMLGDNINDIAAARACGAKSALALWGYLPEPTVWRRWGADRMADCPPSLLCMLSP